MDKATMDMNMADEANAIQEASDRYRMVRRLGVEAIAVCDEAIGYYRGLLRTWEDAKDRVMDLDTESHNALCKMEDAT